MWINMRRLVTKAQRQRRVLRVVVRDLHRGRRIALARARALGPRQWTTGTNPFYCGPVWGTVQVRYVYRRKEYGEGPVQGVGAYRSTTHLGWEVVDPSGRHGWPEVVQVAGRGIAYLWAEVEFVMSSPWDRPKWAFTFEVGQNTKTGIIGDINTLTMPQPPAPPDIEELDAWGREKLFQEKKFDILLR